VKKGEVFMVPANAYQKYKEQEVSMSNPTALIVMLYNGCIKKLKLAQMAISQKNFAEANTHLKKSQEIISELLGSLDLRYPIAEELMALYEFMLREIIQVNVSKDQSRIDPLIDMLTKLRDAWVEVEKTCRYEYEEMEP
jgi:flagellar protein FliS